MDGQVESPAKPGSVSPHYANQTGGNETTTTTAAAAANGDACQIERVRNEEVYQAIR